MGANASVSVQLQRASFFPGNMCIGQLHVKCEKPIEFRTIQVRVVGEIFQRWTSGGGKHRHHHRRSTPVFMLAVVVAGVQGSNQMQNMTPGNYTYPFQIMLPPNMLPSFHITSGSRTNSLRYFCEGFVDIKHAFDAKQKVPFFVLQPIPAQAWMQNTAITKPFAADVTCCCCIDKGKIQSQVSMSKTLLALDRDQIVVQVNIDNSQGKEPVEAITISLICHAHVRIAHCMSVSGEMFAARFPCKIAPGTSGSVNGVLRLGGLAPPSIMSQAVEIAYQAKVEWDIPWASDPQLLFPVHVAHSVDESGMFRPPEQQFAQWQPNFNEGMSPAFAPNFAPAPAAPPPFATFAQAPPPQANAVFPGTFFAQQQMPEGAFEGEGFVAPPPLIDPTAAGMAMGSPMMPPPGHYQQQQQPAPGGYQQPGSPMMPPPGVPPEQQPLI